MSNGGRAPRFRVLPIRWTALYSVSLRLVEDVRVRAVSVGYMDFIFFRKVLLEADEGRLWLLRVGH